MANLFHATVYCKDHKEIIIARLSDITTQRFAFALHAWPFRAQIPFVSSFDTHLKNMKNGTSKDTFEKIMY